MKSLYEAYQNNLIISLRGINFISPLFRKLGGQFPYDIKTFTFYDASPNARQKKLRKLLSTTDDAFFVVVRDGNANLEDVLLVPPKKERFFMNDALPLFDSRKNDPITF
jgi:hypothetical protein